MIFNTKIQGECDKLITIYSYEWGKIYAIVPSAKKITAKLSYATEPLTESEFIVCSNSCSSIQPKVIGANIIKNNTKIKTDFNRTIYALYATEISDRFTPIRLANIDKYNLITRVWKLLENCKYPKRTLIAFILRFLKLSGYTFSDYLKYNTTFIDKNIKKSINKLSNCSGNDLDLIEKLEDRKIWNCIETYITNYIRKPSLSIFMRKLNIYR
ncbi:MAG: DNA repair protein RecO [Endomicrobium sp.]|nr:DNA repair protein RecO [Endomicrobium sp.]